MSALPTEGRPAHRLATEPIGWLTTVRADGVPQSSPVWFVVHEAAIYLRSQPNAAKLRNISTHPAVGFHLDGDGNGGDIVTMEGTAEVLDEAPPGLMDAYLAKYDQLIRTRMGATPEQLEAQFSSTIRITPRRARAW
jgi:PPOX class probable F420-dependent enzyme